MGIKFTLGQGLAQTGGAPATAAISGLLEEPEVTSALLIVALCARGLCRMGHIGAVSTAAVLPASIMASAAGTVRTSWLRAERT